MINTYSGFIFEKIKKDFELIEFFDEYDILESIVTDMNALLKSLSTEEIDIFYTLGIVPNDSFKDSIENLYHSTELSNALKDKTDSDVDNNLKKSDYPLWMGQLQNTKDIETFLEKTLDLKFFFIYSAKQTVLDNPLYIVLQSKDKKSETWDPIKSYHVKDVEGFLNKLSCKTVEIKRGDKNYVYSTSNSGNDWKLENINDKDQEFKEFLTSPEIRKILKDKNTSITIMP